MSGHTRLACGGCTSDLSSGHKAGLVGYLMAHLFRGLHALQVRLHALRPSGARLLLDKLLLQR